MAKKIRHELTYDASPEAVSAMLADPAFREEVCDYQKVLRKSVSIKQKGDGFEATIEQVQAAQGLPSVATKIVGNEITIRQHEVWTSATEGRIEVTIPGKPGDMKGTARIEARGDGAVEIVELEAKVSIPLVGGKLEGIIADMLVKALKAENKVGREYLAR